MQTHSKIVIIIIVLGLSGIVAYKYALPLLESKQQMDTSDAHSTKGKINIGVDNWIGYFPLCSSEMRKRMRRAGYLLQCNDDKADYNSRFKQLKNEDLQFAVATVDSYLLNGEKYNYPGTIVSVIDESKGGDAVVAWKDKIENIDALKKNSSFKVALTPDSPSDHLIKSLAVHFDVPTLLSTKKSWRIETEGSEAALKKLLDKEVEVAVLWEPDVSRALEKKGIVKILGTKDTNKLIVDILLVNRKFSKDNPDAVKVLLKNYFRTLKFYRDNSSQFVDDAAKETGLKKKQVKAMLKGVQWFNLTENNQQWFGNSNFGNAEEGLVDTIESASQILLDNGDMNDSPIPDNDPYRLTNSIFVSELYGRVQNTQFGRTAAANSAIVDALDRVFSPLSNGEWDSLREIGTLKIRPVVFQSGVGELTTEGKGELDKAVEHLKHYPNFRVVIKGHTGKRGNKNANKLLSQERAEAVARYMNVTYDINQNRMRPIGYGSSKPLPKTPGESNRAYNYRLPRVELFLVAEDI